MTCHEIILAHLKSVGADGLCNTEDPCGCAGDIPCCGDFSGCVPAKARTDEPPKDDEECYGFDWRPGETWYQAI